MPVWLLENTPANFTTETAESAEKINHELTPKIIQTVINLYLADFIDLPKIIR